jgi:hypothetical protein
MSEDAAPQSVDVDQVLLMSIETFVELAWVKMGLHADPVTGRTEKDLIACRKAIDAAEALAETAKAHMDEDDRSQLDRMIRDLKLNYTQRL